MEKTITILLIILFSSCVNQYDATKEFQVYEIEHNSFGLAKYKCFSVEDREWLNVIDSLHKYKIGDIIK